MNLPRVSDHELLHRIGRGSYGEVWIARHETLGALRAVKIVFRKEFEDERPYLREFEGLLKFEPISRSHPSQLAILHVGRDDADDCFYYVMELGDAVEHPKPDSQGRKTQASETLEPIGHSVFGARSDPAVQLSDGYTPRTLRSELKARGRLPACEVVE